jgi:hypothetical protein
MLFTDHKVTVKMATPGADDVFFAMVRSNNANQVGLLAFQGGSLCIFTATGTYAGLAGTYTIQQQTPFNVNWANGDTFIIEARGNCYTVYWNGVFQMRWADTSGIYAANAADPAHNQVAMAYVWRSYTTGGIDSFQADDIFIWPSLTGLQGGGTLSAITQGERYLFPAALSGVGTLSATATAFVPFNETNTARTNQPIPLGTRGCYVTLIGAGGTGSGGGGGGGGGGAGIARTFVPVANLGATYSVGVATSPTANSTFTSGSVSFTAGGGGNTFSTAAGAAGTASYSGPVVPAAMGTGGVGGTAPSGAGVGGNGGAATTIGGGGGGAGGHHAALGNNNGGSGGGGVGGGGAGGGGGLGNWAGSGANGVAGTAPGGGGGGGGDGSSGAGNAAAGANGYTLVEWV